ncbi:trypsin-like serine peptidase [Micromonospora echinospora]|uniref:trypsin-like serine peptidase n=1 Tax=Micromonospora echinospora TaxID=1877 RepID=UPI003A83CA90
MTRLSVRRRVRLLAVATATAAALLAAGGVPASAEPATSRVSPDTPTASVSVPAPGPGVAAKTTSSPSFAGTGTPTRSRDRAVDEGAPGTNSIIGADQRYRINPTTGFPYRAVALITFSGGRCTGWFYGPDVVGTAGHCLHSGGSGGSWSTNVVVYPGYNGSGGAPYGSCTAKSLHSVVGWTTNANHEFDYGTVKLNCRLGDTVGWFGYWWQSASLNGLPTRACGYPGDKPLEQWCGDLDEGVQATVVNSTTEKVYYRNDTVGGNSGGPVHYNRSGCGECVMAYHGYGGNPNSGKRITEGVFANMQYWTSLP